MKKILLLVTFISTLSFALKLEILDKLIHCEGLVPQKCMQIKVGKTGDFVAFYDQIKGFKYEEGFKYKIRVKKVKRENYSADESSFYYKFKKLNSKKPVSKEAFMSILKDKKNILYVDNKLVNCFGMVEQKCMRIKSRPIDEWEYHYGKIKGFTYQSGYDYILRVKLKKVKGKIPADSSSYYYKLKKLILKEKKNTFL